MKKNESIITMLAEIEARRKQVLEVIASKITSLPDNENIHRLSKNTFALSINNLSGGLNLDPTHYDFKMQYRCIALAIQKATDPLSCLNEIIVSRKVKNTFHGGVIKLHEEVLKHIKTIL